MSVASKNPFDLLGDDGNEGEGAAPAGSKANVKTAAKPESKPAGRRTTGNEAAFRDRGAGSANNRTKPVEEYRGGHRGGHGARVRGGRGSAHPRNRDDRHSKHIPSGSEKQAAHGWGATEGNAELKDEQAGEEIAKTEQKEGAEEGESKEAPAEPAEPEEKTMSYTDYLAQQAEKKAGLEAELHIRKPNEGSKADKKWASAKPLVKEEEDYFEGTGGKAKRERERKTKQVLEIDNRFVEPERTRGGRGGRGGGRGRGGEFRGRGRGGGGGGGGGGAPRGGGGHGGHGGHSGHGDKSASLDTADKQAFPSLGS